MSDVLATYRGQLKALAEEAFARCNGIDPELGPSSGPEIMRTARAHALYEALALLDEVRVKAH